MEASRDWSQRDMVFPSKSLKYKSKSASTDCVEATYKESACWVPPKSFQASGRDWEDGWRNKAETRWCLVSYEVNVLLLHIQLK